MVPGRPSNYRVSQLDGNPMDRQPMSLPLYRRALHLAFVLLIGTLLVFAGTTAKADQLDDMRASGQVGERADGFLEARDGGAQGFVNEINAKRRAAYEQIAGQQGISTDEVGRIAAEKISGRLPSGAWYQTSGGDWRQR